LVSAALLLPAAVLISISASSAGDVTHEPPEPPCQEPRIACHHECVDPNRDARHCGRCDNHCSSEACAVGRCLVDGNDPTP
jgi:hypothetical protein